jgi:hypothetical protein
MKDGRKNKTFKTVCSQNMKSLWSTMAPEERAVRLEKMRIARDVARAARKAAKQEVAVVQVEQLALPLVQQEYTPSTHAMEEAMAALDILVQVTSTVLGVTLNQQQAAEFWANRLK